MYQILGSTVKYQQIYKILYAFQQEMEAIHSKLTQVEEQLEQREALVPMTRQLNMKLEAGEMLTEEDHRHLYAVMVYMDEELESLKASWLDLYKRDEMNSNELQENRQELIQVKSLKVLIALFLEA